MRQVPRQAWPAAAGTAQAAAAAMGSIILTDFFTVLTPLGDA
ncbi:MAG TPA: hypothetical protein VGL93_26030 [Streptosporangiaceae bacterium]